MNKYKIIMEVIVKDDSMEDAIGNVLNRLSYNDTLDTFKVITSEKILTDRERLFDNLYRIIINSNNGKSYEHLLKKELEEYEVKKK